MRLYDISKALKDVIESGYSVDEETGEVLFDSGDLDELGVALNEKLEACGLFIKNQEAESTAIANEINALRKRKSACDGRSKRMRDYVLSCMQRVGESRLETPKVSLSCRISHQVVIENEEAIPGIYKSYDIKINKNDLKKALKNGTVDGAYIEDITNLQVK